MDFDLDYDFLNAIEDDSFFNNDIINDKINEITNTEFEPIKKKIIKNTVKTYKYGKIYNYDKSGVLKINHKISRGRARTQQLKKMSNKEKNAEVKARMEKNRLSAKKFRDKKKNYINSLEKTFIKLEKKTKQQENEIRLLNKTIMILQMKLQ